MDKICKSCTATIPCLSCAVAWADRVTESPEFRSWDLSQVPGEIDLSGPKRYVATYIGVGHCRPPGWYVREADAPVVVVVGGRQASQIEAQTEARRLELAS